MKEKVERSLEKRLVVIIVVPVDGVVNEILPVPNGGIFFGYCRSIRNIFYNWP